MVSTLSFGCGGGGGQDSASASESESESESESDTEGDTEGEEFEIVRSDVTRDLAPNPSDAERTSDRDGASRFTAQLFGAVTTGPEPNVVFSPHSIRTAFGQVHLGTNGVVKSEIETVLGFDAGDRTHAVLNAVDLELAARNFEGEGDGEEEGDRPPLALSVANSLFSDRSFTERVNADFLDAIALNYDAGIRIVPFDTDLELARERVNGWVAGQTRDKIPELIKFFPEAVELVVVNALYFKASWQTPFDADSTAPAEFQSLAGTSVQVDTMHGYTLAADYAESASESRGCASSSSTPATSTARTGGRRRNPPVRAPASARVQIAASAPRVAPASRIPASFVPSTNSGCCRTHAPSVITTSATVSC